MNSDQKINPSVRKIEIGRKNLRTIEVLPLSIADQLSLSDVLTQVLQSFMSAGNKRDDAFVLYIVSLIQNNLGLVLDLVTEDSVSVHVSFWDKLLRRQVKHDSPLLKELTNEQAWELAELIYAMNYEVIAKKAKDLLKKMPEMKSLLGGSSMQSLDDTLSTDMKISSSDPGEKEA